jgi:hypothetical protein
VEILLYGEDQRLVLLDTLDFVTPLARDLDSCLNGLCTSVHGQDHVEAEQLGGIFGEAREDIVVEGATAEGQPRSLLSESLDKLGVAVALVDGAVGGEEVEVVLALGVPNTASTGS